MEEYVPPNILAMLSPQEGGTEGTTVNGDRRGMERRDAAPNSNRGSPLNKSRHRHRHSGSSEDGHEYVDLLKNIYKDHHALNHAQKEKIAKSVLKGEYNVSQKYEPVGTESSNTKRYDPFPHQAHSCAIRSRHQLNHRMFELTSQPVSFQSANPADKKTLAITRNKVTSYMSLYVHTQTVL